jgi:cytochrome P450
MQETAIRETPYVRGRWLLGHGPDILRRPLELLTELAQHGDVVRFQLPGMPAVLVNHPELVRRVLLDSKTFDKNMRSYARMRVLVGTGLATSDGELWRRQRRISQPAFHRQKIRDFGDVMVRFSVATREAWLRQSGPIDVVADMTRLTLGVVCEALFGGDEPEDTAVFARSFGEVLGYFVDRLNRLWYLPLSVPTPANLRCRRSLADLDGAVYRMIARRRARFGEQAGESTDLLGRMMQARDSETGEGMSDVQLRDEVVTMLLGGHETTAMTLSWAIALLARHPAIQDRLHAELRSSDEPTDELPYLRMVVDETLRLYPPIWLVARNAAKDEDLGGHSIPAGTAVFISPYVLHRSPSLWEAPTVFWPDRFAPDRIDEQHAHAFIPFISGPRQCIGNNFALLEARLALAVLAKRFRFELASGSVVEPEPVVTLRPREGLWIVAHPI